MTNELEFGLAVMTRIIKKAGADRVSEDAANQLRIILEEIAMEISKSAIILSHHAGRKTVKNEDISLAYKTSMKFNFKSE
jgi:histone H3/H4